MDSAPALPQGGAQAPAAPALARAASIFVSEAEAYALLSQAGLPPPRHGFTGQKPPFSAGEPVVLKGLGEEVWHKSELGCVRFLEYDAIRIDHESAGMRTRIEAAGHQWIGGLVCERISLQRNQDLPSEGFVSLSRSEAGWVALFGFGGLQAAALAELSPPCRWPIPTVSVTQALQELEAHLLGRIWLGRLRGTCPLTTPAKLQLFLEALWMSVALAEAGNLSLLELNPVALDPTGTPRPLDAVGRRQPAHTPRHAPPRGFLEALRAPHRIALAGVSAQDATSVGRTILENLRRHYLPPGNLLLVKPGLTEMLGLPCVPDIPALRSKPVDLLLLALPAKAAAEALTTLIQQGGGATAVALAAGGIGDGADHAGLGASLRRLLDETRAAGKWTPAVLGPNFLGHWVPSTGLDTSFIPADKLTPPLSRGGSLTLLSQSGALLLCRRSRQPQLGFRLGVALGNQMDVCLADMLSSLSGDTSPGPVAAYIEGFGPGQLTATADAVARLRQGGAHVVFHRAGCTTEGQAAAASHTGAMAGDLTLERSLLERSGARFTSSLSEFDSVLAWLGAFPQLQTGTVGVVTNAGFESVNGSDLFGPRLPAARLDDTAAQRLQALLAGQKLDGLVSARLPLDLTPMADESAYLAAVELVLGSAAVVVVGLVPFTRRLLTGADAAKTFADSLAALARQHRKPLGVVIDAGKDYDAYQEAFNAAGLPVFDRMESALLGLRVLG